MKNILFAPFCNPPSSLFFGDNVAHYQLGKYLAHVCNTTNQGFKDPIYGKEIQENVHIAYVFFSRQPQHRYFKKPEWINEFLFVENEVELNLLAKCYNFFVNQYRYRGSHPPETHPGYSNDLDEINLYIPAITHKSVYSHQIYLDDLHLNDKYAEFVKRVFYKVSPDGNPIIAIHMRGEDLWNRHLMLTPIYYNSLLAKLIQLFPFHIFVLVGESWPKYKHSRIKNLKEYINECTCLYELKEHNACLQFLLSAYFCRNTDLLYGGMSGFFTFIQSIRPLNMCPPIPLFWKPIVIEGKCVVMEYMKKQHGWCCPEHLLYKKKYSHDVSYQYDTNHFVYFSRDEGILKPYCFNNPTSVQKSVAVSKMLANKWGIKYHYSIKYKCGAFLPLWRCRVFVSIIFLQIKVFKARLHKFCLFYYHLSKKNKHT